MTASSNPVDADPGIPVCRHADERRHRSTGAGTVRAGRRRLAVLPLILLARIWQFGPSRLLPPSCRFAPSCSAYAIEAWARYGVARGSWLAIKRLSRCHPWGGCGVDPVP